MAVTIFILTSNQVDQIGIRLGIRPRKKESGEKIFEYMKRVNVIFDHNLAIQIFKEDFVEIIRECEILFLRNKGKIPFYSIKNMFHIYYELRKLEVPNLHKTLKDDSFLESTQFGIFSFLSPKARRKDNNTNILKPLIMQKISQKELSLQRELNNRLERQKIETAIHLKMMRKSLNNERKNKITFQGVLKDNLSYQNTKEFLFEYTILAFIVLFLCLGAILFTEISYYPSTLSQLNTWFITCVGVLILLIFVYLKQFKNRSE